MSDNLFADVFASADAALTPEQVTTVSLDKIYSNDQVRKAFSDIEELAASILENGQTTPIVVHPADENGRHLIFNGGRREKAFQYLSEQGHELMVDIFVNHNCGTIEHNGIKIPDLKTKVGMISDNVQRDDLRPSEIADDIKDLQSAPYNLGNGDIAKLMGKSPTWISRYSKYIERTPEIEAVELAGVTDGELLCNLVKIHEKNPELLAQLLNNSDDYTLLTRQLTKQVLNEAKKPTQLQDLLSDESIPTLVKSAYFEQKFVSDDAMLALDNWYKTNPQAVTATLEAIKPKAKLDVEKITNLVEKSIFIERVGNGEFNHLPEQLIDALNMEIILSEEALEWAIKLNNASSDAFHAFIQNGEEKLSYEFEREFYKLSTKPSNSSKPIETDDEYVSIFENLSFDVSDSLMEVCPANLAMAIAIVSDAASPKVDQMKLISAVIGRIEAIGISAVESFAERVTSISFVKKSIPTSTDTVKPKKPKEKKPAASNDNQQDDDLTPDFINGELSIGSFSSLITKDEARVLVSKMNAWLAQE